MKNLMIPWQNIFLLTIKFVSIILTRAFMNDNALMDFAMQNMDKFKLPIGVDKK